MPPLLSPVRTAYLCLHAFEHPDEPENIVAELPLTQKLLDADKKARAFLSEQDELFHEVTLDLGHLNLFENPENSNGLDTFEYGEPSGVQLDVDFELKPVHADAQQPCQFHLVVCRRGYYLRCLDAVCYVYWESSGLDGESLESIVPE